VYLRALNLRLPQVPLCVATACCKVLQHSNSASSSTAAASAPAHASERELAASTWRAYCLELPYLLLVALVTLESMQAGQPLPPVALMGQQFQQSGFLDLLPQLLQDTADQLQAATAAAETASPNNTGSGVSSSTISPTQPGNSEQGAAAPLPRLTQQDWPVRPDLLLLKGAGCLLFTYSTLSFCWPRGKFALELVPACAPAVLQLASISFQRVSQLLERHQMDTFSIAAVYDVWLIADEAVRLALMPYADQAGVEDSGSTLLDGSGMPQHLSALFSSPHTGQCMVVMLASAVYTALLLQLPRLPDLSASNSSSRSSSSSSGSSGGGGSSIGSGGTKRHPARKLGALQCTDASQAWQFACEQHHLLPPTHQELLRHVGCSSRAVLSAAAHVAAQWPLRLPPAAHPPAGVRGVYRLDILIRMYKCYTTHYRHVREQQRKQQQQQQHHSSQEQQQQQLLLCLVPGVLLYWAALQPPTVPPFFSIDVQSATSSSLSAVAAAMQLSGHSSTAGIPSSTIQALGNHRTVRQFIPASVREALLADVLTLATRIGARYLASLGAERSDSTTGTTSSGSSSSTRAASNSSTSNGLEQANGDATAVPVMEHAPPHDIKAHVVPLELVDLLTDLSQDTDFSAAGAAGNVGTAQVHAPPPGAAAWKQHILAVAQLLEGTVRHTEVFGVLLLGLVPLQQGPGQLGQAAPSSSSSSACCAAP